VANSGETPAAVAAGVSSNLFLGRFMEVTGWRLRPATVEDEEFLRKLFAQNDVVLKALPAQLQTALLEMQYRGREMTYSAQYPEAKNAIVCLDDGTPIGRHLVEHSKQSFRIVDLALLPEWQGQGIGTRILEDLAQESRQAGVELSLRVVKENPALRLYKRLGFEVVAGDEISYEMVLAARA
jgi:ribosomal protein S18 acetylase RimI-like enzyme